MSNLSLSIFEQVEAPAPRYLMRLALLEKMLESIGHPPTKILEIGPGTGDVGAFLLRLFPNAQVVLNEFSPMGVAALQSRFNGYPNLSIVEQDFRGLPAQEKFDLIVACEVLEHIENDEEMFNIISQRLKPGGCFLMSVPAFMSKWQRVDVYAGHYRRYEREELLRKLNRAHLNVQTFHVYGFPVCNVIYPIREFYYALRLRKPSESMEAATMNSGIDRSLAKRLKWFPLVTLMRPFFWLQNAAKNTNMGDGFLVLARKPAR